MNTLIQKIALALAPKKQRIAETKRAMERRLRAGGLSRTEAIKAVAAHFKE